MREKRTPPEVYASVREYEASPEWKAKSKTLLMDKDCECEICHRKRWREYKRKPGTYKRMLRFGIHHIRYTHVPHEPREDLMVLCWQCHDICHVILRLEHLGVFYQRLAAVVRDYFFYDKDSYF